MTANVRVMTPKVLRSHRLWCVLFLIVFTLVGCTPTSSGTGAVDGTMSPDSLSQFQIAERLEADQKILEAIEAYLIVPTAAANEFAQSRVRIESLISELLAQPASTGTESEDSVLKLAVNLVYEMQAVELSAIEEALTKRQQVYVDDVLRQVEELRVNGSLAEAQEILTSAEWLTFRGNLDYWNSKAQAALKQLRSARESIQAAIEKEKKARNRQLLSKLYKKRDSFEGISWYYDRATYSRYATNRFQLYMGVRDSGYKWLYLRLQYYGDDWIFWDTATIKADGAKFVISADYFEVERDNSGGAVWEWYDFSPGTYELEMISAVIRSKKAVIRFEGDTYYADRVVTAAQQQAFKNVLAAYDGIQ